MAAASSEDEQAPIYSGDWHAQDLLYTAPYRERVDALIGEFLSRHAKD